MKNERDEQFLKFYQKYRYEDQVGYYEKREKEYEEAQNEFVNISTILMILAAFMSVFGSINVFGYRLWWAVLAVVFPTVSAALSTYSTLYAFERQGKIFQDAVHRLYEARAKWLHIQPLEEGGENPEAIEEYRKAVEEYVGEVEKVFMEERGQWGLLGDDIKSVEPPISSS